MGFAVLKKAFCVKELTILTSAVLGRLGTLDFKNSGLIVCIYLHWLHFDILQSSCLETLH